MQNNQNVMCPICNNIAELAYYKNELMCMNCAKDEMFKDGSVYRGIINHGS